MRDGLLLFTGSLSRSATKSTHSWLDMEFLNEKKENADKLSHTTRQPLKTWLTPPLPTLLFLFVFLEGGGVRWGLGTWPRNVTSNYFYIKNCFQSQTHTRCHRRLAPRTGPEDPPILSGCLAALWSSAPLVEGPPSSCRNGHLVSKNKKFVQCFRQWSCVFYNLTNNNAIYFSQGKFLFFKSFRVSKNWLNPSTFCLRSKCTSCSENINTATPMWADEHRFSSFLPLFS